ncbi:MAG: outer membrane beta-barrel protein [Desulfuromonadales bacterium]|nr:outer membrane beta-barrel protein [Desulfuromonadales bacterium]
MQKHAVVVMSMVLASLILTTPVYAKDLKMGTFEVSGSTGLSLNATTLEGPGGDEIDVDTASLVLDGKYYFVDNFAIGLTYNYLNIDSEFDGLDSEITAYGIGPIAEVNLPLSSKAALFGNFSVGVMNIEVDGADSDGYFWGIGGGLKYFLNDSVSMNGALGYTYGEFDDDDVEIDNLGANFGISIYF